MNKLGLIESLRQQITSLEDEVEEGCTQDGEHLDEMDIAHRNGMINQCEILIDEYKQDTEPEVNGHELKRLVYQYRAVRKEHHESLNLWGKAHPDLPYRDSPECEPFCEKERNLQDQISAIFVTLAIDAGLTAEELDGLFSAY